MIYKHGAIDGAKDTTGVNRLLQNILLFFSFWQPDSIDVFVNEEKGYYKLLEKFCELESKYFECVPKIHQKGILFEKPSFIRPILNFHK